MKSLHLSFAALVVSATSLAAQSAPGLLTNTPGGADAFCYYAGLAYSEGTDLVIDIANRREGTEATQKAMLKCTRDADSGNLVWVRGPTE